MKKAVIIYHELLLSFGVAVCIGGWSASDAMLHGPRLSYALQPIAAGVLWWLPSLVGIWSIEALLIRLNRWAGLPASRHDAVKILFPLYICYVSALQPTFTYFAFGPYLFTILTLGILYSQWRQIKKQEAYVHLQLAFEKLLGSIGDKRIALILGMSFIGLYILVSSAMFAPLPDPEGDEPHYLVTTYSLLTDGDLLLTNNYAKNDYALWHEGYVQPHTKAGIGGVEYQYPMHNVGLSAYLVPFMAIGLAIGGKAALLWFVRFGMVLLTAAFLALLYLLLSQCIGRRNVALGVVILTGVTAPILFYSYHIFTEIPALLLLTYALHLLLRDQAPGLLNAFLLGAALGALPWLGIKYITLAVIFVVVWIYREFSWGIQPRRAVVVIVPGLILGLWFLITTHAMFGTYNPAAYQFGTDVNLFSRSSVIRISEATGPLQALALTAEAILAYLIGQHQGLLFYAPWMLLGIAGLWRMTLDGGTDRKTAFILLVLALPYIVIYGITGLGGGHSPPGRTMIPLLWLFILPSAWMIRKGIPRGERIFAGVIATSILIAAVLLAHPAFLYHDFHVPASHLLSWLSTPFINMTAAFPSLFNRHFVNWDITAIWCGIIVAIISIWSLSRRSQENKNASVLGITVSLATVLLIYAYLAKTPPLHEDFYSDDRLGLQIFFQKGDIFLDPHGFWIATGSRENCFIVHMEDRAKTLPLRLRSVVPNTAFLRSGINEYGVKMLDRLTIPLTVTLADGFSEGNRSVRRLLIQSYSGNPQGLALPSGDRRPLGLELTIRNDQTKAVNKKLTNN